MKKTIVSVLLVTITTIAAIGFSGCTRSSSNVGNAVPQTTASNSNQSNLETKKSKIDEEKKTSSKAESQRENSSKADEQKKSSSRIEERKESSSNIKTRKESLSEQELHYENIYHDDEYDNDEYHDDEDDGNKYHGDEYNGDEYHDDEDDGDEYHDDEHIPDTTSQVQNNVKEEENENPYIVVSIEDQMLWYYEYNTVVFSSPVVTGMDGATPIGTFEILNKAKGITLIGEDYESYVDYWIAFKGSGYGFHDASWRSEFGGNIYKYNGSHGCVNMPHDKVEELYYMVELGTPVYIS